MMKRFLSMMLAALLVLLTAAAAFAEGPAAGLAGGWEIADLQAAALPDDAQAAFDKATENLVGAQYVPAALIGTQVVAGVNYCILCQITPVVPDARPVWALVYIYADLQGGAEITNVYELYFDRHAAPAE